MNTENENLALLSDCDYRIHILENGLRTKTANYLTLQTKIKKNNETLNSFKIKGEIIAKKIAESNRMIDWENERIKHSEAQLAVVKNHKIYVKLKSSIGLSKQMIKFAEERFINFEEQRIEIQKKLDIFQADEKSLQQEMDLKNEALSKINLTRQKELEKLKTERTTYLKSINPQLLWKYNRMLKHGINPVVSKCYNASCGSCSMSFPDRIFQLILEEEQETCPHCKRILIYEALPKIIEKKEEVVETNES